MFEGHGSSDSFGAGQFQKIWDLPVLMAMFSPKALRTAVLVFLTLSSSYFLKLFTNSVLFSSVNSTVESVSQELALFWQVRKQV